MTISLSDPDKAVKDSHVERARFQPCDVASGNDHRQTTI